MHGGTGNDLYYVNRVEDVVIENANEGIDTVRSDVSYTLGDHVENLELLPNFLWDQWALATRSTIESSALSATMT